MASTRQVSSWDTPYDAKDASVGFLRGAKNGGIANFRAPGAGTGEEQGTLPISINEAGTTAGYYYDASRVAHGFLMTP